LTVQNQQRPFFNPTYHLAIGAAGTRQNKTKTRLFGKVGFLGNLIPNSYSAKQPSDPNLKIK
jgi:hypothetical protein